jgi:hypothetical protein
METKHPRISLQRAGSVDFYYIDYEGLTSEEASVVLHALTESMKETSLPFIANFKGLKITPKYLIKANEWISVTRDRVPFGAFIGFNNTHNVIFEAIKSINGLKHGSFRSYEEAAEAIRIFYSRPSTK